MIAAIGGLLVVASGTTAVCQTTGRKDFEQLCASCHGNNGKGKGILSEEAKPTDLTQITKKNGGKFPFETVYRIVDGREMIESHKRFAMPFWGQYLQKPGSAFAPASDAQVKQRIADVVRYIKTLQER
jgi:mono/diheme cytochrome c family protein